MSDTQKRILSALVLCAIAALAALGEHFGLHTVKYMGMLVVIFMIAEMLTCMIRASRDAWRENGIAFVIFFCWLFVMLAAIGYVGTRPWIVLLLLLTISAADIGAWFFGTILGGDKMWERLSAGKTWAGQIAGIICGTVMCVMYGLLGIDTFMPQLMWIGISVSLLSQYGDLTASWIKRKIGIKDFGNIIPGHGGMLDRFDGWIYVLPLVWLVML